MIMLAQAYWEEYGDKAALMYASSPSCTTLYVATLYKSLMRSVPDLSFLPLIIIHALDLMKRLAPRLGGGGLYYNSLLICL